MENTEESLSQSEVYCTALHTEIRRRIYCNESSDNGEIDDSMNVSSDEITVLKDELQNTKEKLLEVSEALIVSQGKLLSAKEVQETNALEHANEISQWREALEAERNLRLESEEKLNKFQSLASKDTQTQFLQLQKLEASLKITVAEKDSLFHAHFNGILEDMNQFYDSLTVKLDTMKSEQTQKTEAISSIAKKLTDCCYGNVDARDNSGVSDDAKDDTSVSCFESNEVDVESGIADDSPTFTPRKSARKRRPTVTLREYSVPSQTKLKKQFSCKRCGQDFKKSKQLKLHHRSCKPSHSNGNGQASAKRLKF